MKHKLLGMFLAFGVFAVNAADFYVDANSTAETPDGSQASPYKTIVEAVNAANAKGEATGEATFVYIRALGKDDSGNDIPYVFDDKDDLVLVTATNMTITSWGDEKPLIELAANLGKNVYDATEEKGKVFFEPNAITLGAKTKIVGKEECDSIDLYCEVKNLRFCFFGKNQDSLEGQSLGAMGKVIRVNGRHCIIDGCEFKAEGSFKSGKSGRGVVGTDNGDTPEGSKAQNDRDKVGKYLTVRNCRFYNIKNLSVGTICVSNEGDVNNNVFVDCDRVFYAVKQATGGYFVSNKVVNCTKPFMSTGGGYGETPNGEIAYNIFVFDRGGVDFFNKAYRGFSGAPKIHHNTVVGARSFINIESIDTMKNDSQWTPAIYDNLIILNGEGSVICENTVNLTDAVKTSFKSGSYFKGNAYYATRFLTGTAMDNPLYDITAGLDVAENYELGQSPVFLETEDIYSPDYYRLNSVRYPWVVAAARGESGYESPFVGALEPVNEFSDSGEFFQINSFEAVKSSDTLPVKVCFSVNYSQNIGDVVSYWDFDGDGIFEEGPIDGSCSEHIYTKGGIYKPHVKLIDSKTNIEREAGLNNGLIKIKTSEVYVDSLAADGGNGSKEHPLRTLQEGIVQGDENSVVYVRGGADRIYEILNENDLIVITEKGMEIKSWGDYGNAVVIVDHLLSEKVANPKVVTVEETATGIVISDLDFVYYGATNAECPGNSIGKSDGRIIKVMAEKVVVKNCGFKQCSPTTSTNPSFLFALATGATEQAKSIGKGLKVEGCRFIGDTGDVRQMGGVWCGTDTVLCGNVFVNCGRVYEPLKNPGEASNFLFTSNRLFNCASLPTNAQNSYNDLRIGEFSYNVFVTTIGDAFLKKGRYGLDKSTGVLIHHNTVVGASAFIYVPNVITENITIKWSPNVYDNLLILREGGNAIWEDAESCMTSFVEGARFINNAYLGEMLGGGVTELEDYKTPLLMENNYRLTTTPRFLSTDLNSPDYYRLKSRKGDWAFATATGGYPNYVGAIEPQLMADGFSIVVR